MSKDLNKCCFIGRLGNDPDMRALPDGTAVANISLAVGDDYKDKRGQKVEQTEWVRITFFGKLAEVVGEYLRKGSKIYAEGKMRTRKYDKDGQTHYATEIVCSEMLMLDSKGEANPPGNQHRQAQQEFQQPEQDSFDDDIPFN